MTDAKRTLGVRRVKLRGVVRDALLAIKPADMRPDALVFATSHGRRQNPSNIRNRILAPARDSASESLVERGSAPLPPLIPHSWRRTFASLLYALGERPAVVMAELGHTSPALALRVYARAMRRDAGENEQLTALVEGVELSVIGSRDVEHAQSSVGADATSAQSPPD